MTAPLKTLESPEPLAGQSLGAAQGSDADPRWIEHRNADWNRFLKATDSTLDLRERLKHALTQSPQDILDLPQSPEWYDRDMEGQYRKGFYHGVAEAAELIVTLYRRGGYVRPQEIANIIGDWTNALRKWKSKSHHEKPLQWCGHPRMKWHPWMEVKKLVHERDEWSCVQCGSKDELEAHHVESVKEGGLPDLENLVTLCNTCHRHPNDKLRHGANNQNV